MYTLARDLILLSAQPATGMILDSRRLGLTLAAAELVQLAWSGRIEVRGNRVAVLSPVPGGDGELDAVLAGLAARRRPPSVAALVRRHRPRIVASYAGQLAMAGLVTPQRRRLRRTRWRLTGPQPRMAALARLDAVARWDGPVTEPDAALGGLAGAGGLGPILYPGRDGRAPRRRLALLARQHWAGQAVTAAVRAQSAAASQAGHVPPPAF